VLIIDADEEITSDMTPFKERLGLIPQKVGALAVNVTEISDGDPTTQWLSIRFFRKGVRYKHAVHNKAVFDGDCAMCDVNFNHYGYSLSPEQMESKRLRTEKLLKKRLKDPEDLAALYYMTQMRIGQKRYKEAEEYGLRFFQTATIGPGDLQFTGVMYFFMTWTYLHLNDGEKAYAWAMKGLEFYPGDLDLTYMVARIGFQAKRDDVLKEYANKYFEMLPKIRGRGRINTDKFESVINAEEWFNRTVYCAAEAAEQDMKKFLEVAA
jgi:hypothetical protein